MLNLKLTWNVFTGILFFIQTVPFDEDDKDKSVWFLDHDYLENMYGMFKKVNGEFCSVLNHNSWNLIPSHFQEFPHPANFIRTISNNEIYCYIYKCDLYGSVRPNNVLNGGSDRSEGFQEHRLIFCDDHKLLNRKLFKYLIFAFKCSLW